MYQHLKDLLPTLLEIAYAAGDAIMDIYNNADDIGVEIKSDDSPLTLADKASNVVICKGLENLAIKWPIVSEENKAIAYEERSQFDYYWLVDPLDGTKEFIKRNGDFTVNIALVHKNEVVLGVVGVPCHNEMYWAIKGAGAFMKKGEEIVSLKASDFSFSDSGLRLVCSRSHLNGATQQFVDNLDKPILVPRGSALKFLILAKGDADVYPRLGPTMEWDTAAAQIVLEEAGGFVINEETDQALRYNKENLLNPYFIAYGIKNK